MSGVTGMRPGIWVVDGRRIIRIPADGNRIIGFEDDCETSFSSAIGPFAPAQIAAVPGLVEAVHLAMSACGNPDPAQGCRNVIAILGEAVKPFEP